jgi:hypothetical protein
VSHLTPGDRRALVKLIQAARLMDEIFREQRFYPEDMTAAQFEQWAASLPPPEAECARGFFTVIRRQHSGQLEMVPFHKEYAPALERAAALLREAAAFTENLSLGRFLEARAASFLNDDYYTSDLAWMDVDAPLDITIGPYETYKDELFGYKASFEAYICVQDTAEGAKLQIFAAHLQEIEDHLPIDPEYRNPRIGADMPIRVVNQILAAGDANDGFVTAAFNLPNDERVVLEKGSKKVMLKNIQHAKFDQILTPIARLVLPPDAQADLSFEWFFNHILAHEISHGLGPQQAVRQNLKELYSPFEEAKADITSLFMLQYLFDAGHLEGGELNERRLYRTFLASAFRTLRFGIREAHGRGMALQFNYLRDQGAFVLRPDGTFEVNFSKMKGAVRALASEILTIEARGDYAGAQQMLEHFAVLRPEIVSTLEKLKEIPVDIQPLFVTADELTRAH